MINRKLAVKRKIILFAQDKKCRGGQELTPIIPPDRQKIELRQNNILKKGNSISYGHKSFLNQKTHLAMPTAEPINKRRNEPKKCFKTSI